MGVSTISGAAHGPVADYRFDWSNQSSIMRVGALMCHKVGGNDGEVVVYGEATAGEVIGPCLSMKYGTSLTEYLPTDGTGICSVSAPQRPGRADFILAASQGALVPGDYLIPTGTVGAVKKRPAGSNQPPVAKVLYAIANLAAEQYIYAEVLTGGGASSGIKISAFGADAPATNKWLSVNFANHANAAQHLFLVPATGKIRDLVVRGKTAPGAGKTITYTVHKSSDGGATFVATALTVDMVATAGPFADNTHIVDVTQGDVLAIKVTSADVGLADLSNATFAYE